MELKMKRLVSGLVALIIAISFALAFAPTAFADAEDDRNMAREQAVEIIELFELSTYFELLDGEGAGNWFALVDYLTEAILNDAELYGKLSGIWEDSIDKYSALYEPGSFDASYSTYKEDQPGLLFDFETDVLTIWSTEDNSPARVAGIVDHSIVLEWNGVKASENMMDDFYALSRSYFENDSTLNLKLQLPDGTVKDYVVVGADYDSDAASGICDVSEDGNTGYIAVRNGFNEDTHEKFAKAWKAAEDAGVRSVIIDLRDNGGGFTTTLAAMLNTVLPARMPTYSMFSKNELKLVYANGESKFSPDIVILTNEYTASAAEVFTSTLRYYGLARSIGTTTYGKGIGQSNMDLSNGKTLSITSLRIAAPDGSTYNLEGIAPDVEITDDPATETDEVLDFAYGYVDHAGVTLKEPEIFRYTFTLPYDRFSLPTSALGAAKRTANELGVPVILTFISSDGTKMTVDVDTAYEAGLPLYLFGIDKEASDALKAELTGSGKISEQAIVMKTADPLPFDDRFYGRGDYGFPVTITTTVEFEPQYFYRYNDGEYIEFKPNFTYEDGKLRFVTNKGGAIIITAKKIA
jgi:carboxyl-terminal processing protease